jgi:hypothetical protein
MSTTPSSDDQRPADQQARAEQAHPTPQKTDTPQYGEFGHAQPTSAAPANNSGHNDNPDEFSEFRKPNSTGTEDYSAEAEAARPAQQPGHVEQNQDPAAVRAAQDQDADVQRTAWADDDPRYAGGGTRTSWPSNEPNNIDDNPATDGQR